MSNEESSRRVLIAGSMARDALELCYARAFGKLGHNVTTFDLHGALSQAAPMGRIGALLHTFWPSDAWIDRANRELLVAVLDAAPDVVIASGYRLTAGALAQIRCARPGCRIVLLWPDTFLNCHGFTLDALPLYHLVATYSRASVEPFRLLGARAAWVPLGFDPTWHSPDSRASATDEFSCDVSFVGNHNPEREKAIATLSKAGLRVKVWGHPASWKRAADKAERKKYFQGRPLFGKEFSLAVQSARMSINPIAISNYPAANMRFFEIAGAGGTALNSACPEMDGEFVHGRDCYYFEYGANLIEIAREILDREEQSRAVRSSGQERVLASHTYIERARRILELLDQKCDQNGR